MLALLRAARGHNREWTAEHSEPFRNPLAVLLHLLLDCRQGVSPFRSDAGTGQNRHLRALDRDVNAWIGRTKCVRARLEARATRSNTRDLWVRRRGARIDRSILGTTTVRPRHAEQF